MIKYKIRGSDWLTFPLIIVNFNHFFIQPAPGEKMVSGALGAQGIKIKRSKLSASILTELIQLVVNCEDTH